MKNKGITSTNILIIVAVIVGLAVIGGLGYMAYQNWFGETKLAAQYYTSQQDCEDADYYWYDEACHSKQQSGEKPEQKPKPEPEPSIVDCGVSESFLSDKPLNQIDLEKDSALVCLGENLLSNCKNSKAIMKSKGTGDIKLEIKGSGETNCKIKYQYGDVGQISSSAQKPYANKYVECSVTELVNFLEESPGFQFSGKDPSEAPGGYVGSLTFMIGMISMDPQSAEKAGCEGTLIDYVKEQGFPK